MKNAIASSGGYGINRNLITISANKKSLEASAQKNKSASREFLCFPYIN